MIDENETIYRNEAILQVQSQTTSLNQVLVKVSCDDLDQFLEYEIKISGKYLRNQCQAINRKCYSLMIPEGITLLQFFQQNVRFTTSQIEEIYKQLLQALYEIHKNFSLGRCFHLGNIYYHNNQIKLAAFGFYPNLQLIPPENLERREQTNKRLYSQNIDAWLVGCILYQVFTGEIINRFKTIKDYKEFYNKIQQKNIENNWKSRLLQMLNPKEAQRYTFFQMHLDIQNSIQKEMKNSEQREILEFYQNYFLTQNYSFLINLREQIDENFIEWAVPKEFTQEMELPKVLNPFRHRLHQLKEVRIERTNANPYPRIVSTSYYSQPIQPSPPDDDESQYQSNQSIDTDPIIQSPIFLTNRCRDENDFSKYKEFWTEIHFESYKWYLMKSLQQNLKDSNMTNNPIIILAVYCLQKMSFIMRSEFLNQWNTGVFNFDRQLWLQFIEASGQARRFHQDVRLEFTLDESVIDQIYTDCINQLSAEDQNQELFKQIQRSISNAIIEKTFQDFKLPFRKTLRALLYYIANCLQSCTDHTEILQLTLLQLKVIICMAINQIFLPSNRNALFRILKQQENIPLFDNPYYLEQKFFQQQDIAVFKQQIQIIEQDYFGSNQ